MSAKKKNGNPNQPTQLTDESENTQKKKAASTLFGPFASAIVPFYLIRLKSESWGLRRDYFCFMLSLGHFPHYTGRHPRKESA